MFLKSHNKPESKTITDIEYLNLRLSGMRVTEEYEFTSAENNIEIAYYNMSYANGSEERIPIKRTICEKKTVIDALNGFDFIKWNGFHGNHPRGVLDGTMFKLTAVYNGGERLQADGSQNFPKHFNEFRMCLYVILNESEETGE